MIDSEIRVGDVVRDLTQNALMQVVDVVAETVAEHRDREGFDLAEYKTHPLFDVSDDEPVFACVYLGGELTVPSQSYDFPASRLARVPVEEANQDLERVQDAILMDAFALVFAACGEWDDPDLADRYATIAQEAGIHNEVVDAAIELGEAWRLDRGE